MRGRALPEASRPHLHANGSQVAVDSWRTSLPSLPTPGLRATGGSVLSAEPQRHRSKTPLQPAFPARACLSSLPPSPTEPRGPPPLHQMLPMSPMPLPAPRWGKPPREAPASLCRVAPPAPPSAPKGAGAGPELEVKTPRRCRLGPKSSTQGRRWGSPGHLTAVPSSQQLAGAGAALQEGMGGEGGVQRAQGVGGAARPSGQCPPTA